MQTKTKTYAQPSTDHCAMDSVLPTSFCIIDNSRLTHQEEEVLKTLCQTKGTSIWAQQVRRVCREVIQTGDCEMFRDLLKSLVSQMYDNELLMKNILGEDGIEALRKVSSHRRLVETPVVSTTGSF